MAFKLAWKAKDGSFTGMGPILGNVKNSVFIPLTFKQVIKRAEYFSKTYKRAKYYLAEVPIMPYDTVLLKRIHAPFTEIVPEEKEIPQTAEPTFYLIDGTAIGENPLSISFKEEAKAAIILDPEDTIDSDWDLDEEEEDDEKFIKEELKFK